MHYQYDVSQQFRNIKVNSMGPQSLIPINTRHHYFQHFESKNSFVNSVASDFPARTSNGKFI